LAGDEPGEQHPEGTDSADEKNTTTIAAVRFTQAGQALSGRFRRRD
jgi:hypothetical protein